MKPKSLFKRVVDFARAEIERRAKLTAEDEREEQYAPEHRWGESAAAAPAPASVQRQARAAAEVAPNQSIPESPDASATWRAAGPKGLEVTRTEQASIRLAWSLAEADVAQARALLDADAVLCVRVVAFSPLRDDVLRQVRDRPGVDLQGSCDVGQIDGAAVVAIGLRAGERFVSINHHTL